MSQPFSFPPPPPPPPRPFQSPNSFVLQQAGRGVNPGHTGPISNRGGRGFSGGRGGGQYPRQNRGGHSSQRGAYGAQQTGDYRDRPAQQHGVGETYTNNRNPVAPPTSSTFQQPPKRNYAQAFPSQKRPQLYASTSPRPPVPPANLNHGYDVDTLFNEFNRPANLPAKPPPTVERTSTSQPKIVRPATKKTNLFGLSLSSTGQLDADDESEDDADEEARLAVQSLVPSTDHTGTNSGLLSFSHRGQTLNLRTPEEIQAWIAERRRNWPTESKRAEAVRIRAEKAQVAKEAKQKLYDERVAEKKKREIAKVKAQMIKRQIEVARQADLAKISGRAVCPVSKVKTETIQPRDLDTMLARVDQVAQAQLVGSLYPDTQQLTEDLGTTRALDTEAPEMDLNTDPPDVGQEEQPAEDTSTSGSSSESDSDDDAPPEVLSSRTEVAAIDAPHPIPPVQDQRPLCKTVLQGNKCRFGKKCRYSHNIPKQQKGEVGASNMLGRRKGIYQVLVDKEIEDERRRAVEVIIQLGESGMLDEPGPTV